MEYWQADLVLSLDKTSSLPGNIQFSLRYRNAADEYWDNNQGDNYSSEADFGIKLASGSAIQNISFTDYLNKQQSSVPFAVVVDQVFNANKVTIHWTTNG